MELAFEGGRGENKKAKKFDAFRDHFVENGKRKEEGKKRERERNFNFF